MAEDPDIKIGVGASVDKQQIEKEVKKIPKIIDSSLNGGHIEININTLIDDKDTKSKLSKAQKDVVRTINKMSKEGFSASAKDIDTLNSKMTEFGHQMDQAGKGRQNKIFREIRRQVEEIQKSYKDIQKTEKSTRTYDTKTRKSVVKNKPTTKKTSLDRYLDKQEEYSRRSKGAVERRELKEELAYVRENKSPVKSSGNISPSMTNDYEMRASKYSEHRSKWAQELAATLKMEISRANETLVKWIDKDYEIGTRTGEEKNPIDLGNRAPDTTESQFLTDVYNKVKGEMSDAIAKLEAGDEDITVDTLTELAAVMRVLNKTIMTELSGKSLSEVLNRTMNDITFAVQGRYGQNQNDRMAGTDLEEGQEKGVGPGHERTQKLVKELFNTIKKWDSEIIASAMAVSAIAQDKTFDTKIRSVKASDDYKNELNRLNSTTAEVVDEVSQSNKTVEKQTRYDMIENSAERTADKAEGKKNDDIIAGIEKDLDTGTNTDAGKDEIVNAIKKQGETNDENNIPMEKVQEVLSNLGQLPSDEKCPCQKILEAIYKSINGISKKISGTGTSNKSGTSRKGVRKSEPSPSDISKRDTVFERTRFKSKRPILQPSSWDKDITPSKGGLPALYRYLEDGKLKTAQVQDKSYTEGLIELKSPNRQLQKEAESKVLSTTSDEYYKKQAAILFKQSKKNLKNKFRDEEKQANEQDKIEKREQAKERAKRNHLLVEQKKAEVAERKARIDEYNKKYAEQEIPTIPEDTSFFGKLQNKLKKALSAEDILGMSEEEIKKLRAQRINTFGLADVDRNPAAMGDKIRAQRTKSIYGWRRGQDEANPFRNLKMTEGININIEGLTDALQDTIQDNMFDAQTGGGPLKQLMGAATFYAGQPSLEKSRATIDAANEMMAVIRNTFLSVAEQIKSDKTDLKGLQAEGKASFNEKGEMTYGTPEAITLFADLKEKELSLRGIVADVQAINQLLKDSGGDVSVLFSKMQFFAPELRKCNKLITNINSGLDKNGKALKFQKRSQEVLNYSYQLMARHIGQIFKNFLMMINPISLIKRAFSDFAGYSVKWQRTMNVIKYNIRRIIKPFMEWLAQQFVNIIGLANALIKGIGKAFGQNWDLFDQSAANTEKMKEDMEAISNVTAGFDELHDIGTDNSGANDLLGDIYTPQWTGLNDFLEGAGEKIGSFFARIRELTKDWNFWTWLAVGAGVLIGLKALKWLIDTFRGKKNPLQSLADGVKSLLKSVGVAAEIAAFALFVKTLGDFLDKTKDISWDDLVKSLKALGLALLGLVAGIVVLAFAVGKSGVTAAALAAIALVIGALALLVYVIGEYSDELESLMDKWMEGIKAAGEWVKDILEGLANAVVTILQGLADAIVTILQGIADAISTIINTIADSICKVFETIGNTISQTVESVATGIKTVLEPILEFIDKITDKITGLAETIVKEIGKTIRKVVETVGQVVIDIIHELLNAIPRLLDSVLNFTEKIGPAIKTSASSIRDTITETVNFIVSMVEYAVNSVIRGINSISFDVPWWARGAVGGDHFGFNLQEIHLERFYPQYKKGTNYVPNDGLAYLHQGEAVIPKKYNQPMNAGMSNEERAYMQQIMNTMKSLDNTMKQGIAVNGQFVQRGSDLVAVVNKTKSQTGADLLSNVAYAR